MAEPPSVPTWEDYADDLYRTKRQTPWGRIIAVGLVLILASGASFALARPLISGEQAATSPEPDTVVREAVTSLQQQMEVARLSGEGTYVFPYSDNPHRDASGVTIAICFGPGNSTYTVTGYRTAGNYFNASSKLPGAVSGPEPVATCSAPSRVSSGITR